MGELYDTCETILLWAAVIFAVGLIFYLAYAQYRSMKRRRARYRRKARRAMRELGEPPGEHQRSHNHHS
jgi:hypothetical protein